MSTPAEIMAILADTALAFPGYDKGKLAQAAKHYVKALATYDAPVIQQAADALIQSSRFFPSVSEFVAACREVQSNTRPNQVSTAMLDALMMAHDREYEAAHPFVGERWWEAAA